MKRTLARPAAAPAVLRRKASSRGPLPKITRFRPLLLSRLLGKNSIRPPKGALKAPSFALLRDRIPRRTDRGAPVDPRIETPASVEMIQPPEPKSFPEPPVSAKDFHWHPDASARLYHSGSDWGRAGSAGWAWIKRAGGRWWINAQPAKPGAPAEDIVLVRHAQRWWWQANSVWFLLHDGQPWGYRYFPEWQAEGLMHPGSGTRMIYSADGARIALVVPGRGAVVYDAYSGAELARLSEEQLPRRPRPRAPERLSLPP